MLCDDKGCEMKQKILRPAVACILTLTTQFVCAQQMEDGYTWTASDMSKNNFFIHYPSIQFDAVNPDLVYAWFKYVPANLNGYSQNREVINCSNLLTSQTNIINFNRFGKVIDSYVTPIRFIATNPNSVGEAKYKAVCTYKAYLQQVVP